MSQSILTAFSARPTENNNGIQANPSAPELSHPVGSLLQREIHSYHLNRTRYCRFVPLPRHTVRSISSRRSRRLHRACILCEARMQQNTKLLKGPQPLPPCSQNKLCEALVGAFLDPGEIAADRRQGSVTRVVAPSHRGQPTPALVLHDSLATTSRKYPHASRHWD